MKRSMQILVLSLLVSAVFAGCGSSSTTPTTTTASQLERIRAAGLSASATTPMAEESPGVPGAAHGVHFVVKDLVKETGIEDAGGGVFVLEGQQDFEDVAGYYASFRDAGLLATWSCVNPDTRTVLYLNGDAKAALFKKYCDAIDAVVGGD